MAPAAWASAPALVSVACTNEIAAFALIQWALVHVLAAVYALLRETSMTEGIPLVIALLAVYVADFRR